jgi:hypothetical protein
MNATKRSNPRRARPLRALLSALSLIAAVLLLPTSEAHAYLDPGTGSIIVQGVIGGIAAALVVVKLYWQKLKGLFGLRGPANGAGAPAPRSGGRPSEPIR